MIDFISVPVTAGFTSAAAITIASGKDLYLVSEILIEIATGSPVFFVFLFQFGPDRQKYTSKIWFEEGFGTLRCGHFINYNYTQLNLSGKEELSCFLYLIQIFVFRSSQINFWFENQTPHK